MIRVKIELVPHGNEADKATIGEIVIKNRYQISYGWYRYEASWWVKGMSRGDRKSGVFDNITHDRSDNVFYLLYQVLDECVKKWGGL